MMDGLQARVKEVIVGIIEFLHVGVERRGLWCDPQVETNQIPLGVAAIKEAIGQYGGRPAVGLQNLRAAGG